MYGDFNRIVVQLTQHPVMYIQMARLEYYLGKLSCKISCSREETALHYAGALHLLEKGGFDLGIKKWVELVSLRIENSKKE